MEAAARVFASKEFHEVLIDDIAAAAGVGKGTIYRYFETKEDLYFATILDGLDDLAATLDRSLSREVFPARRLEKIAREILRFFWNRRDLLTLIHSDQRRSAEREQEMQKRRDAVQRLVQQTIPDGIERGQFRGVDARLSGELFRGMIRAAGCFRHAGDSLDDLVAEIMGVFTQGIAKQRA